jgi:hypothetical protein
MVALMTWGLVILAALLAPASPPQSAASSFTLVNGTAGALSDLSIRRVGTQEWKALGSAPGAGARAPISFNNQQDCSFDIRATVPGAGPVTWADVNLCDVKSVTLKRDGSAGAWVDYDQ